jgi:tricorn protease
MALHARFPLRDNVHGAPWDDVWRWYEPWLAGVNHRSDFNHLLT